MPFSLSISRQRITGEQESGPYFLCRIIAGTLDEHFEASASFWQYYDYVHCWKYQLERLLYRQLPGVFLKSIGAQPSSSGSVLFYYALPDVGGNFYFRERLCFPARTSPNNWEEFIDSLAFDDTPYDEVSTWRVNRNELERFFEANDWNGQLTLLPTVSKSPA